MAPSLALVVAALLSAAPAGAVVERTSPSVRARQSVPAVNRTPVPSIQPKLLTLDPYSLKPAPELAPETGLSLAPPAAFLPGRELAPPQEVRLPETSADPALQDLQDLAVPREERSFPADGADLRKGRALFDNARDLPPDVIPYEPKPGETVRIGGVEHVLGEKIFSTWHYVYRVKDQPGLIVKFLRPDPRAGYQNALEADDEVGGHARLEGTKIAHTRLLAHSQDDRVLLKEYFPGETAGEIAKRGPLSAAQVDALADLAAELLRGGHSADLNRGNLVWDEENGRWVLIDAGFFRKASPSNALAQLFFDPQPGKLPGVDGVALLAAIRDRLGAGSPAWKAALSGWASPEMKARFAALAEADKAQAALDFPVEGNIVTVSGVDYVLGRMFVDGLNAFVFRVQGRPGLVLKIQRRNGKGYTELKGLELLSKTKAAHTGLVARSPDGRVLVKEYAEGETAAEISRRGPYSRAQLEAFASLMAEMIRSGVTGDLNRGNFVWDAPKGRWILIDAGGLDAAKPWQAFARLFTPGQFANQGGLDKGELLLALRGSLGPRSDAWKSIEAVRRANAHVNGLLETLAAAEKSGPRSLE